MKWKITSLRLIECGPIDDLWIDFTDDEGEPLPIAVIGGANGSGKTTVLEAIVRLMKMPEIIYNNFSESVPYTSQNDSKYMQLGLKIDEEDCFFFIGELPSDANLGNAFLGFERVQKDNFIKRFGDNTQLTKKVSDEYRSTKKESTINKLDFINEKTTENGQLPSLLFFPHLRYLENQKGHQINKEIADYQLIYRYENIKTFKGSLQSYLIWLDYAESELFKKIITFLNDLNFGGKTFHIKRKDLAVLVKTKEGHIHQLHELSSGEQNIIIILTELWRRLDRKNCIVLIDEIENSLHPAYQHFFAKALRKLQKITDFQLIVTTHSSEIVTQFGTPSLRILTKF